MEEDISRQFHVASPENSRLLKKKTIGGGSRQFEVAQTIYKVAQDNSRLLKIIVGCSRQFKVAQDNCRLLKTLRGCSRQFEVAEDNSRLLKITVRCSRQFEVAQDNLRLLKTI